MNIFLWVLQVLLALHTAMGAFWKFTNSVENVPSLSALPNGIWMGFGVIEIICAIGLVLPALSKKLGVATPLAAGFIVFEMLIFCVLHLTSGKGETSELVYWLVVALICGFIAYGRFSLKPF
jgi:hypothetical protein